MEAVFETKPLLGPDQARSMQEDMKAAQATLANPMNDPRVDKAAVQRQLRRLQTDYERQVPRPPENAAEEDRMVKRERELLERIVPAMLSHEEMRKAPAGATPKFMASEGSARIKRDILEWKHIRRRRFPDDPGATNLEVHRPVTSTLNMDSALIPGKNIMLPPTMSALPVTFSPEQIALLQTLDPKLAARIGTLDNSQRATVKELVAQAKGLGLADEPNLTSGVTFSQEGAVDPVLSEAGKRGAEKKKRIMGAAQKAALAAGRAKAKAAREAKQAEKP